MFTLTLALGVGAVVAIALSPLYAGRLRPLGSMRLGAAFISLSLGIALVCVATPGTSVTTKSELFLCSFVLMLVGAALVLCDSDDPSDEEPRDWTDGEPPWWPEFEAGFRSYARRRRPLVPTR
jgi:1,4-dihydroxy-2-naphthoate octaprenyltransferase